MKRNEKKNDEQEERKKVTPKWQWAFQKGKKIKTDHQSHKVKLKLHFSWFEKMENIV